MYTYDRLMRAHTRFIDLQINNVLPHLPNLIITLLLSVSLYALAYMYVSGVGTNSRPFGGGLVRRCLCVFAALVSVHSAHKDFDEQ